MSINDRFEKIKQAGRELTQKVATEGGLTIGISVFALWLSLLAGNYAYKSFSSQDLDAEDDAGVSISKEHKKNKSWWDRLKDNIFGAEIDDGEQETPAVATKDKKQIIEKKDDNKKVIVPPKNVARSIASQASEGLKSNYNDSNDSMDSGVLDRDYDTQSSRTYTPEPIFNTLPSPGYREPATGSDVNEEVKKDEKNDEDKKDDGYVVNSGTSDDKQEDESEDDDNNGGGGGGGSGGGGSGGGGTVSDGDDDLLLSHLTYSNLNPTYSQGLAITPNTVVGVIPAGTTFAVAPLLPNGLAINASTGTISGTPLALADGNYTVTATLNSETKNIVIHIAVTNVPLLLDHLTYSNLNPTYTYGQAITSNTITGVIPAGTTFTVAPALPNGLTINSSTGAISGTPLGVIDDDYTITATLDAETKTFVVHIVVNNVAPTSLTYDDTNPVYMLGVAILDNNPIISGGISHTFSVAPALPAGLIIDADTGVISGTPTVLVVPAQSWVVTATNSAGSTTRTIMIRVEDQAAVNPVSLRGNIISTTSSRVMWSSGGLSTTGYLVSHQSGNVAPADCSTGTDVGMLTTTVISGLDTTQNYSFRVCAYNVLNEKSSGATLTIAGNNLPVATNFNFTINEDVAHSGTLLATDADGDPLKYFVVSQGENGTVSVTDVNTGSFTYTPRANFYGSDTFTFLANDGIGNSNISTVTITINSVNDGLPVITVPSGNYMIGGTPGPFITKTDNVLLFTATDFDNDPITWNCKIESVGLHANDLNYIASNTPCENIRVLFDNGEVTWNPERSRIGTYKIGVTASDAHGSSSAYKYVSVIEEEPLPNNVITKLNAYFSKALTEFLGVPAAPRVVASANCSAENWLNFGINPNTATLNNFPAAPCTASSGWVGDGNPRSGGAYALSFDGSNDYGYIPTPAAIPTGNASYSVSMWVKSNAASADNARIFARGTNNLIRQSHNITLMNNSTIRVDYWGDVINGIILSLGRWYHVTETYNGANTNFYINGVLVAGPVARALNIASTPIYLGSLLGGGSNFSQISLADFRLYNAVLTDAQIKAMYDNVADRYRISPVGDIAVSSLVLHYDAANAKDRVGNYATGCAAGTLVWSDLSKTIGNGALTNFAACATDGWAGDGTVGSPYRLVFDGVNDAVYTANHSNLEVASFTISSWIKIPAGNTLRTIAVKDNNNSDGVNRNYWFGVADNSGYKGSSAGQLLLLAKANGVADSVAIYSTNRVDDDNWHHVAAKVGGGNVTLYIDGVEDTTSTYAGTVYTGVEAITVGASRAGSQLLVGELASVKIFNDVLSYADIQKDCLGTEYRFTANAYPNAGGICAYDQARPPIIPPGPPLPPDPPIPPDPIIELQNLSYADTSPVYIINEAITTNYPVPVIPVGTTFSISPTLVDGLSIDPVTGEISGTPTSPHEAIAYVVTATKDGQTKEIPIVTRVLRAPTALSYDDENPVYIQNEAIIPNTPTVTDGIVNLSFYSTPELPAGLTLNPLTGIISGTPADTVIPAQTYTITVVNSAGEASVDILLRVSGPLPKNPISFNASAASATSIALSWVHSGGGNIGYKLSYAQGNSAPANCLAGIDLGMTTSHTVTGLLANQLYSFRLCGYNSVDELSTGVLAQSTTQIVAHHIKVVTASSGSTEVDGYTMSVGQTYTLYAVAEDASNNFIANVPVTWSISNAVGSFSQTTASSVTFTATSVGRGVVNATHSTLGSDSAGEFVVTGGTPTKVKIVTSPAGNIEFNTAQLNPGQTITLYAVSQDENGHYVGDVNANWVMSNAVGSFSATTGTSTVFTASSLGSTTITASFAALTPYITGNISITAAGDPVAIKIMSSAGGAGSEIGAHVFNKGESLTLYSISVNAVGQFIADESVAWSMSSPIGTFSQTSGSSTTFTATRSGTVIIRAQHTSLTDDTTDSFVINSGVATRIKIVGSLANRAPEILARTFTQTQTLMLYAVAQDADGDFVENVSVDWSGVAPIGTLSQITGKSSLFTATTLGTATITATHATLGTDSTGVFTVGVGEPVKVKIVTTSGGNIEYTSATMTKNQSITLHAISLDANDNVIGPVSVAWSIGRRIGNFSTRTGSTTTFTASALGMSTITASHAVFEEDSTDSIKVTDFKATQIKIVTQAGGSVEVNTLNIAKGTTYNLYAVAQDLNGDFISNVSVNWGLITSDNIGTFSTLTGSSTTFTAIHSGTGSIRAYNNTLADATTGEIFVYATNPTRIKIVQALNSHKNEIDAVDIEHNGTMNLYAVSVDVEGDFVENVEVTWNIVGDAIGSIAPVTGTSTIFTATGNSGLSAVILADHPSLVDDSTGVITVWPTADHISIETQADGNGVQVDLNNSAIHVEVGQTIDLYAISREENGDYIGVIPVTWEINNANVAFDAGSALSKTIEGLVAGNTQITIRSRLCPTGVCENGYWIGNLRVVNYCHDERLTNSPYANSGIPGVDGLSVDTAFEICTGVQLDRLGQTSGDWNKFFKQKGEVDLSAYTGAQFNRIGNSGTKFNGTYDGEGNQITNFSYSNNVSHVGLFGYIGTGTVKNIFVNNANVLGGSDTGIVAGRVDTGTVESVVTKGTIRGGNSVGGVVGSLSGGIVQKIASYTNIETSVTNVGGIVGYADSTSKIRDSYSRGSLYVSAATEGNKRAGILGHMGGGSVEVSNVYSTGRIYSPWQWDTAGLVGYRNNDACKLSNSFTTSIVIGGRYTIHPIIAGGSTGAGVANNYYSTRIPAYNHFRNNLEAPIALITYGTGIDVGHEYFYSGLNAPMSSWSTINWRFRDNGYPILNWMVDLKSTFIEELIEESLPTENSFDFSIKVIGDSDSDASATLYWCDQTLNAACNPLTGTSVVMAKQGPNYRSWVPVVDEDRSNHILKVKIILNDPDGVSGGSIETTVLLASKFKNSGEYGVAGRSIDSAIEIDSAAGMNYIGTRPDYWNRHYKLVADIDMSVFTGTQYNVIGNLENPFTGSFDGNGYMIKGFTFNGATSDEIALFGATAGASFERIRMYGINVVARNNVAGFIVHMHKTTISDSHFQGAVSGNTYLGLIGNNIGTRSLLQRVSLSGSVTGSRYLGGVARHLSASEMVDSYLYGLSLNYSIGNAAMLFDENRSDGLIDRVYVHGTLKGDSSFNDAPSSLMVATNTGTSSIKNSWTSASCFGADRFGYIASSQSSVTTAANYVNNFYNSKKTVIYQELWNNAVFGNPLNIGTDVSHTYFNSLTNAPMDQWNDGDTVWVERAKDPPIFSWQDQSNRIDLYWIGKGDIDTTNSSMKIEARFMGDKNADASVTLYVCSQTENINCVPENGPSFLMNREVGAYTVLAGGLSAYTGHILKIKAVATDPDVPWTDAISGTIYLAKRYNNSGVAGIDGKTEASAYEIATAEQLNNIGKDFSDVDKYFKLIANIDLSAYTGNSFNIIGDSGSNPNNVFSGQLDGNGYRISNFTYAGGANDNVGLVRYNAGLLKNIIIHNADVSGNNNVGIIAGVMNQQGEINKAMTSGLVTGADGIGGIVGNIFRGAVRQAISLAEYKGVTSGGGISGIINTGVIEDSFTDASFNAGGSALARWGGIIGYSLGASQLNRVYSTGLLKGSLNPYWIYYGAFDFGGIYGLGENSIQLTNSFVDKDIISNHPAIRYIGPECAACSNNYYNTNRALFNYNSGEATAATTGIGLNVNSKYFYSKSNSPLNTWDFDNVWIEKENSYPSLRWYNDLNFIHITSLNIENILSDKFTVVVGYYGDNNHNAEVKAWYCDATANPACDPVSNSFGSTLLQVDGGQYIGTVTDLGAYSGKNIKLSVVTNDVDGVEGSPKSTSFTLVKRYKNYGDPDVDGLTPQTAYEIETKDEFNRIGLNPEDRNKYFKIVSNIDMTGVNFNIIGSAPENCFQGQLDGQGHIISNLSIDKGGDSNIAPISNVCNGIIKDIHWQKTTINAYARSAGLVAICAQCSILDNYFTELSVTGIGGVWYGYAKNGIGGVYAVADNGSLLERSLVSGSISGSESFIAGVAGQAGNIKDVAFVGSVSQRSQDLENGYAALTMQVPSGISVANTYTKGSVSTVYGLNTLFYGFASNIAGQINNSFSTTDVQIYSQHASGCAITPFARSGTLLNNYFDGRKTVNLSVYNSVDTLDYNSREIHCSAPVNGVTKVDVGHAAPYDYFYRSTNPPLNTWDFVNTWLELPDNTPLPKGLDQKDYITIHKLTFPTTETDSDSYTPHVQFVGDQNNDAVVTAYECDNSTPECDPMTDASPTVLTKNVAQREFSGEVITVGMEGKKLKVKIVVSDPNGVTYIIDRALTDSVVMKSRYANSGSATGLSAASAFQISSCDHLSSIGLDNKDWDKFFKLTGDIDLTGCPLNMIGSDNPVNGFVGEFDGQGFKLSNMTINAPTTNHVGLFRSINESSVIKNLQIENASVIGQKNVGALLGLWAGYSAEKTQLENISIVNSTITGNKGIGGVVGVGMRATGSTITASGTVSSSNGYSGGVFGATRSMYLKKINSTTSVSGTDRVGGLIGNVLWDLALERSSVTGATITGSSDVGGVVGYVDTIANGAIKKIFVDGITINNTGSNTGGLVGQIYSRTPTASGTLVDSFANATISGMTGVGGAVGLLNGSHWSHMPGFERVYSTGFVTGTTFVGGLVGAMTLGQKALIKDSFTTANVSGNSAANNVARIIGTYDANLTSSNLSYLSDSVLTNAGVGGTNANAAISTERTEDSYFYEKTNAPLASWDFASTWLERPGVGYPILPDGPIRVKIYDGPCATGSEVGVVRVAWNTDVTFYACSFDTDDVLIDAANVSWTVTNSAGTFTPSDTATNRASSVVFRSAGSNRVGVISVTHPTLNGDSTGDIRVSSGARASLKIVTSPTSVTEVTTANFVKGNTRNLYAVYLDSLGDLATNYEATDATWSIVGTDIGALAPALGSSSVFTADTLGTATIRADGSGFNDSTGNFTVAVGLPTSIKITTTQNSPWTEYTTGNYIKNDVVQLYTCGFDVNGDFTGLVASSWSLVGDSVGIFLPSMGTSTAFRANAWGTAQVRAVYAGASGDLTDLTGNITVAIGPATKLKVVTTTGGSTEVVDDEMEVNDTRTFYAVSQDVNGDLVSTVTDGIWSVTDGIGNCVALDDYCTFTASNNGTGRVKIEKAGLTSDYTGFIEVREPAVRVVIEDSPLGFGAELDGRSISIGDDIVAYAVARTAGGNFKSLSLVDWQTDNNNLFYVPLPSSTKEFSATTNGTTLITADHASLIDDTALITISDYCSGAALIDSPYANSSSGGDGLSADTAYTICTANQLNSIGQNSGDFNKYFKLMNDLDLSGFTGTAFNLIGTLANPFIGTFDGRGFRLSNFTYSNAAASDVGLFRVTGNGAVIKKLQLLSFSVSGNSDVGGLVGEMLGGSVSQVAVTGTVVATGSNAGGLVGNQGNPSVVEDCFAHVNVESLSNAGGLIGYKDGAVSRVYATGKVSAISDVAGGLFGYLRRGATSNSFANADVFSSGTYVGNYYGNLLAAMATVNEGFFNSRSQVANTSSAAVNMLTNLAMAVDVGGVSSPDYFYKKDNLPLSNWDFDNVWVERGNALPVLRIQNDEKLTIDSLIIPSTKITSNSFEIQTTFYGDIDGDGDMTLRYCDITSEGAGCIPVNDVAMTRGDYIYSAIVVGLDAGMAGHTIKFSVTATDPDGVIGNTLTGTFGLAARYAQLYQWNSNYPPDFNNSYVKVTSSLGGGFEPWLTTNPSTSLTGGDTNNCWVSLWGNSSNQRFHIDIGSANIINRIYYENGHSVGSLTDGGARNFTLWGTNDAASFNNLTWATDTGWTKIVPDVLTFDQHINADVVDPKYLLISNNTAYRYYALKFENNYGRSLMSVRRIELQNRLHLGNVDRDGLTPATAIEISTAEELNNIGKDDRDLDKFFKLTANIDLTGYNETNFNLIGVSREKPFRGNFNGNGYKISNFSYSNVALDNLGLFRFLGKGAKISNLQILNATISGRDISGILVGEMSGGLIENCGAEGSITGRNIVGGLVGFSASPSNIIKSYANVSVNANASIGAFIGLNRGIMSDVYAKGSVNSLSGDNIGGLVGKNDGQNSGNNTGTVARSYFTGTVNGVGNLIGGLIGYNRYSTISNSFTDASVLGLGYIGALIGSNDNASYSGNYYNLRQAVLSTNYGEISSQDDYGVGVDVSNVLLNYFYTAANAPLTSWNFITTWTALPNSTPIFAWQGSSGNALTIYDLYDGGRITDTSFDAYVKYFGDSNSSGSVIIRYCDATADANCVCTSGVSAGSMTRNAAQKIFSLSVSGLGAYTGNRLKVCAIASDADGVSGSPLEISLTLQKRYNNSGTGSIDGLTLANAFEIATAEELNRIGIDGKDMDKYFKLVANIDMSAYSGTQYKVIGGNRYAPFRGYFDGNGYQITGLSFDDENRDGVGMFGYVVGGATIKNVVLKNVNFKGRNDVGAIAGEVDAAMIERSYAQGTVIGNIRVGGLVGFIAEDSILQTSHSEINLTGNSFIGGVVGENRATINDSYATGTVVSLSGSGIGGFAGYNTSTGVIRRSYAKGFVSSNSIDLTYIAGFVGNDFGVVENSFTLSDVFGVGYPGAFVSNPSGAYTGNRYSNYATVYNNDLGTVAQQGSAALAVNMSTTPLYFYDADSIPMNQWDFSLVWDELSDHTPVLKWEVGNKTTIYDLDIPSTKTSETGLEVYLQYAGDSNSNSSAIFYYCDASTNSSCIPTLGTSVAMEVNLAQKYYFKNVAIAGLENKKLNVMVVASDVDGVLGSIKSDTVWLKKRYANSGLPDIDGSLDHPFEIETAEQLNNIGLDDKDLDKNFKLMNNINLGSFSDDDFNLIGQSDVLAFSGTFNGNNKTISGFNYSSDSEDSVGIFKYTRAGAKIHDLNMSGVYIVGNTRVGSLIGTALNRTTLENIQITSGTISANSAIGGVLAIGFSNLVLSNVRSGISIEGYDYIGSIAGYVGFGSTVTGAISFGSITGNDYVGGLVGMVHGATLITKASATGAVLGNQKVGGLVGWLKSTTMLSNSYSAGNVTATSDSVGGLIGRMDLSSIDKTYASGNVTSDVAYVAGLVGNQASGTISNSFSVGEVTGSGDSLITIAALTNKHSSAFVNSCYFNSNSPIVNISGGDINDNSNVATAIDVGGSSPLNYFKTQASGAPLSGWDFVNIWREVSGAYPQLR